ncbi:MAG: 50S ribosomal protein L16 [Candidatus Ranarchaeia archaeon]
MPVRPAHCYTKITRPPYTRRKYMRGVPGSRIVRFDMGDTQRDFPVTIGYVSLEHGQIRHNALEAARVATNAYCNKHFPDNFHIRINVKPHQVLRENKMMAFAGADRIQAGMRRSFGKPSGTAARISANQVILYIRLEEKNVELVKGAIKRAMRKMPVACKMVAIKATDAIIRKHGLIPHKKNK